jgi:outer membrane protein
VFNFRLMTRAAVAFAVAMIVLTPMRPVMAQEAAPAPASEPKSIPIFIGVVDVEKVLRSSTAGQALDSQSAQLRKKFQADVLAKEKQLRAEGEKFKKQRATMTEEQQQQALQALQANEAASRKEFEARRKSLDTAYNGARKKIFDALNKAVLDVSQKRGLTLVIKKSVIVASAQAWDITDVVLVQLNKLLPSVKM